MLPNHKLARKILNSMRCPLCGGQIDLRSYKARKVTGGFNYGCATFPEHYQIKLDTWTDFNDAVLKEEAVNIEDGKRLYRAIFFHPESKGTPGYQFLNDTGLTTWDIDPEGRCIEGTQSQTVWFKGDAIGFRQPGKDRILKRIKTLLTFQ